MTTDPSVTWIYSNYRCVSN